MSAFRLVFGSLVFGSLFVRADKNGAVAGVRDSPLALSAEGGGVVPLKSESGVTTS
jgi:hypothetical protein